MAKSEFSPGGRHEHAESVKVNPYDAPEPIEHGPLEQTGFASSSHVPWGPGWYLIIPLSFFAAIAIVIFAFLSLPAPLLVVVAPVATLAFLAATIRWLHAKTTVVTTTYVLLSVLFGIASYILFVPICTMFVLPIMMLGGYIEPLLNSSVIGAVLFALPIAIAFILFSLFLRSHLKVRHLHQRRLSESSQEITIKLPE